MFYAYVIQSKKDNRWYTGCTNDLRKRFRQHNHDEVISTKSRGPFTLIYYEACLDEIDAFAREKYLKSGPGKRYLKNRLKRFLSLTGSSAPKKSKACLERSRKVFVAMSGGVDSSVAAALLARSGDFDVVGAHMLCWEGCDSKNDQRDALKVTLKLGIPFLTFDFRKEYREKVFEYMVREYAAGRTPNPDVMCNREIKFGVFLERALEEGADYIATGHYVRLATSHWGPESRKRGAEKIALNPIGYTLMAARDTGKDQSYFLWTLTQEQLKHCLFPVGNYLKSEVRTMARQFGLPTAEKKDSQGLCFVGKVKFEDFIKEVISGQKGKIALANGKIIGEHDGASFYTIGQRHGVGASGNETPYYVARKNMTDNTLIVARKNDPALYKREISANNINWISDDEPKFPLKCKARIRYRQPLQDCEVYAMKKGVLKVLFKKPLWTPASGQSVVFYKNNQMLGGGVLE